MSGKFQAKGAIRRYLKQIGQISLKIAPQQQRKCALRLENSKITSELPQTKRVCFQTLLKES